MKRTSQLRRCNRARRKREFPRAYGSPERVAFVRAQPCVVRGCARRPCQNAHVESGGMGRKANADKIVPACQPHHYELDTQGRESFERKYALDLQHEAAALEAKWQQAIAETTHAF